MELTDNINNNILSNMMRVFVSGDHAGLWQFMKNNNNNHFMPFDVFAGLFQ